MSDKIKKVLVPVDFTLRVHENIDYAVWLAENLNVKLFFLNVINTSVIESPKKIHLMSKSEAEHRLREKAKKKFEILIKEHELDKYDIEILIESGKPAKKIVEVANKIGADLIVTRSCGRRGLMHFIFGSTSEQVVRMADCPILVLKYKKKF